MTVPTNPFSLVHERFAEQVLRAPENTALVFGDERLSYRELDTRAGRFAGLLAGRGVGRGALVGVYLERSTDLVVAVLGTLRAGAGYVMLDPDLPAARLRGMAEDARVRVVVAGPGADLVGDWAAIRVADADATPCLDAIPGSADDAACVMFTSGSTGRPKGIVASHHAITATLTGQDFASFGAGAVWLQCAPVSWDAFALELWGPLLGGGTCVLHPGQRPDPTVMGRLVAEHGITSMYLSSSLFNVIVDEYPRAIDGVRELLVGGEALSPVHAARALLRWPDLRLSNGYGPVEGTVFLTVHHVDEHTVADGGPVPIGQPLAGKRVHVLDERLRPVADGVTGELYASGAGIATGYAGQPGLTAERFLADPWGKPGERMYRTGDLVRRRADGVLEFLGRADAQVKIRGFRVEPGEVETVLARHPRVARVAVVAAEDDAGERGLVAYVVARDGYDERELRGYATDALADYLVPGAFVTLDALPLLANGKLDRAALPAPQATRGVDGRAAAGETEQTLCGLFAEVLGRESVGVEDNFLALGGHSLLVAKLLGRIHAVFGAEIEVRALFEAPTPATLSVRVAQAMAVPAEPASADDRGAAGEVSPAQRRLWFLDRTDAGVAYNLPMVARLRGAVDADAMAAALGEVVARHEPLRTVFDEVDGAPVPRVLAVDTVRPGFEHAVVAADDLENRIRAAARHRFDLGGGPLILGVLFTVAERPDEHALLLVMHHIAADGWSLPPLFRDLSLAYAGQTPPPLAVGYAEHAARQRQRPAALRERQLAYWTRVLAGTRAPLLARRADDTGLPDADVVVRRLDAATHAGLVALGREHGATLFMVLHTALAAVLAHAGAGADTAVAAPVAGRGTDGTVDDVVGFFVNLLVLRADTSADPTVRELLAAVRDTDLAAFDHQDVPFEEVVDAVNPPRRPGRQPFTDVVLALQNNAWARLDLAGVESRVEVVRTGAARFDLLVDVLDDYGPDGDPQGLAVTLEYRTGALERDLVEWHADALVRALTSAVADPDLPLSRLGLVEPPRLPTAEIEAPQQHAAIAPRTELERRVAEVWTAVLGVDSVGVHDDFFMLGGNSLRAVRVVARLTTEYGGTATAAQFLAAPTVAQLAAALAAGGDTAAATPIPRRARVPRQQPAARQEEAPWTSA
ncbi:amino acid adenylation domain-containing protein [Solihabitans fulvus]|uniref:Amino acid adenylation domain-containing protein n=1 Tax=Solihabitans fulvus TaxID=1892852 RepID=A0A5B2WYS8_9PSEU|nr:non-ribosomal peptide synthetase [Solihabitans fulvus]KAA2256064.1 amino acid adenylation domain-containing protein [Solihabitans fulvus]